MCKTTYQKLDVLESKEFLQRIINVLNASEHGFGAIRYTLEKEEEFCREKNIKLPENYPAPETYSNHEESENR